MKLAEPHGAPRSFLLLVLGVVAAFAGPHPVVGQEGHPVRLSVGEAVERAQAEDESVRLARAQQDLADAQIVQARADALPDLSATVGYNRTLASIFDGISLGPPPEGEDGAALPFGQANAWTAALSVSQPIYSGGRVGAALGVARRVEAAARLGIEEAELTVAYETRAAYFQALLATELVAITRESHAVAEAHLAEVRLRRAQGTVSDFEELQASVERDNLEPAVIEAAQARRLAELNLKRLVHLDADTPIELTTPLAVELSDVDRATLRAAALERPSLRALDEVVGAREGARSIAAAARLPSVSAFANFGYQSFPSSFTPIDATWRRDWTLGFQVSIPLFDGLRTRGAIDQAEVEVRQAELQRSRARSGASLDVESALAQLDGALARSRARRSTVEQARRALELAELRFSSGMATQLDVSNSRLLLEQARVNEVQALHDYINALARLEQVTGGAIPLLADLLTGGN